MNNQTVLNLSLLNLLVFVGLVMSMDTCSSDTKFAKGTGPTDHWPTVENAEACKLQHCSREMAACLVDPTCLASFTCPSTCADIGDKFVSGLCGYECGETAMLSSKYVDMMTCWGTHRCTESRVNLGGACAASSTWEGSQDITSLEQVSGFWWVVRGWNCEASGLTFATCQHWKINQTHNHISFALRGRDELVYKSLYQLNSLPYKGVLRGTYDATNGAFPNLPQLEDYHIIDYDDEHLLIIACHGWPEWNSNTAIVLSRSGDNDKIPPEVLERFNAAIKDHGYGSEDTCIFDNSQCKDFFSEI